MQSQAPTNVKGNSDPVHLRDKVLLMRTNWRNTLENLRCSLAQYVVSREHFMAYLRDATMPGKHKFSDPSVLTEKLANDENTLLENITEVQRMEPELSRLEYILMQHDQNMFPAQHGVVLDSPQDNGGNNGSCSDGDTIDDIPEAVTNYFDAIGDTRLMATKLLEDLPAEYAEELAARERKISQDIPLDLHEQAFQETWKARFKQAQDELTALEDRAKTLRHTCVAQGLNIDPTAYSRKSHSRETSSVDTGEAVQDWLRLIPGPTGSPALSNQRSWGSDSLRRQYGPFAEE